MCGLQGMINARPDFCHFGVISSIYDFSLHHLGGHCERYPLYPARRCSHLRLKSFNIEALDFSLGSHVKHLFIWNLTLSSRIGRSYPITVQNWKDGVELNRIWMDVDQTPRAHTPIILHFRSFSLSHPVECQ